MAEYRLLTRDCLKRLDDTCKKIAMNEPKVWLTVEEARKTANAYADLAAISRVLLNTDDEIMFLGIHNELMHRIREAEKKDD